MKLREAVGAVLTLAIVSRAILPRNNTAQVLQAVLDGYSHAIKASVAIKKREPRAIDMLLAMVDDDRDQLIMHLTPEDMTWLNEQLDIRGYE